MSKRGMARFEPQKCKEMSKRGGEKISQDRQYMAEIGRKGGLSLSANKQHMAEIGRKGGSVSRKSKLEATQEQFTETSTLKNKESESHG